MKNGRPARFLTTGLLLLSSVLLLSTAAGARDDVPDEIAGLENPQTLSPERVPYWQKQFRTKCARCHGPAGDGKGKDAATQSKPPRDLTDADYMDTRSDGQLFYQISVGGGEDSPMPGFGPDSDQGWSEEKIWQMVAFVRRFSRGGK